MKGPLGKGHAEMAVSKTKNSDYVTPDYDGDFPIQGWEQEMPFSGTSSHSGFFFCWELERYVVVLLSDVRCDFRGSTK